MTTPTLATNKADALMEVHAARAKREAALRRLIDERHFNRVARAEDWERRALAEGRLHDALQGQIEAIGKYLTAAENTDPEEYRTKMIDEMVAADDRVGEIVRTWYERVWA